MYYYCREGPLSSKNPLIFKSTMVNQSSTSYLPLTQQTLNIKWINGNGNGKSLSNGRVPVPLLFPLPDQGQVKFISYVSWCVSSYSPISFAVSHPIPITIAIQSSNPACHCHSPSLLILVFIHGKVDPVESELVPPLRPVSFSFWYMIK